MHLSLAFFDSFDWRLHAAGLRLLQVATPQGKVLRLKNAAGAETVDAVEISADPGWPADLPVSDLRRKVADLLEMRVLLPVARVDCEVTGLGVLNEGCQDRGAPADAAPQLRFSRGPRTSRTLWPRLRLVAVKGYEDDLAACRAACGQMGRVPPDACSTRRWPRSGGWDYRRNSRCRSSRGRWRSTRCAR